LGARGKPVELKSRILFAMPRHLHLAITVPCAEDWYTMTGSDERRHCDRCDKHVVALAEMTPEEAVALVMKSKPQSLCLRVEHDEDGTVLFRDKPAAAEPPRHRPIVRLAVGASMLLSACAKAEPPAPQAEPAPIEQSQADKPSEPNEARAAEERRADSEGQTAVGTNGTRSTDVRRDSKRDVKGGAERKTRVTVGCACQMGDALCSCL